MALRLEDTPPPGQRPSAPESKPALVTPRFDRHEVAASIGDIGVMIPLAVGVAATARLSLATVFLCVAASYVATALVFRVPLPVQPMKAMGASIIALGLSSSVVMAAGIEIALLLLLLAATPLARYLARLFPRPVLRGIQLSVGLLLLKSGLLMATGAAGQPLGRLASHLVKGQLPLALVVAFGVAAILLVTGQRRRLPASIVVVALGIAVTVALAVFGRGSLDVVDSTLVWPLSRLPNAHAAALALFVLVVPQLPLSLGNSVFATEDVMHAYYGRAARRVTGRRLLVSLGLMNLCCAATGGMPLCHGAGGATAHYRLGARTAGATLIAGGLYTALALAAARGISPLIVPAGILAGMLLFVGVEHCLLIADLPTVDEVVCAVLIAVLALAFGNLALGFVVGWIMYRLVLQRSPLQGVVLRWPRLVLDQAAAGDGAELEG